MALSVESGAGMSRALAGVIEGDLRLSGGGAAALHEFTDLARTATAPLVAEVFNYAPSGVTDALRARAALGRQSTLLLDAPVLGSPYMDGVRQLGASLVEYGDDALHSKIMAAGSDAVVSTGTISAFTGNKLEVTARLSGHAADATRELAESAVMHDPAAMRSAAARAARAGVVINDPIAGVNHIDAELEHLFRSARQDLNIVTKEFNHPAWAQVIADRSRDGVQVNVVAREITPADRGVLEAAGVRVSNMPFTGHTGQVDELLGHRLHFTSVFADGNTRAYAGTRYLWDVAGEGVRPARDVGIIVDGANAARLRSIVHEQVGARRSSVVRRFVRQTASEMTHPATAARKWGAMAAHFRYRGAATAH